MKLVTLVLSSNGRCEANLIVRSSFVTAYNHSALSANVNETLNRQ